MNLFCGCNVFRMCLNHSGITRSVWIDDAGVHHVRDLQQEYAERCRAVTIMEQFRKVLAVIAWAAAHCPYCRERWIEVEYPCHDPWCPLVLVWPFKAGAVFLPETT